MGSEHLGAATAPEIDASGCEAALQQRLQQLDAEILSLQRRNQAWLGQAKQIADGQRLADQARHAHESARASLERLQQDVAAAQRRAEVASAELAQMESRQSAIEARLAPLWAQQPSWRPRLATEAATLRAEVERVSADVTRRREASEADRQRAQEVGQQLAGLRASAEGLAANASSCDATAVTQQRATTALESQRAALLGGQPADVVEARLQSDVARQSKDHEVARSGHARSASDAATASEAAKAAERQRDERIAEQRGDDAELARLLATMQLDEAKLAARLAHDEAWSTARAARIRELDAAVQRAEGAVRTADESLRSHLQSDAPALAAEQTQELLAALSEQRSALQQQIGGMSRQLADDDGRRAEAVQLDAVLDAHDRAAQPWLQLHELIGSADGKVFRLYAQGLTLDVLVAHANSHLRELSRRYRLQRVPGADLELQIIDGDMADEVRALTTLSGGETFLVSLALALGLASLSSRATAIESLFIDEGFGTLDPETLEVAMSALDGLQQTGRKVGVISHVPGLAEQLGVQIAVRSRGAGRSDVQVRAGRS